MPPATTSLTRHTTQPVTPLSPSSRRSLLAFLYFCPSPETRNEPTTTGQSGSMAAHLKSTRPAARPAKQAEKREQQPLPGLSPMHTQSDIIILTGIDGSIRRLFRQGHKNSVGLTSHSVSRRYWHTDEERNAKAHIFQDAPRRRSGGGVGLY